MSKKVSAYKNSMSTEGQPCAFEAIMVGIKNGRWKDKVEAIRQTPNKDKIKELKRLLPAFTGSGLFSKREIGGLIGHSGRIIIDFDKLPDVNNVREVLKKDPYTEYLFVSCSGNGIAVVVKIPDNPKIHLAAFTTLQNYYKRLYGYELDKSCKDITRLRYISYDPDLYQNPEPVTLSSFDQKEDIVIDRGKLFTDGTRDDDLFTVAHSMIKGGVHRDVATETLVRLIRSWGESVQDPEKWATEKVNNAIKRNARKDDNASTKVDQIIDEMDDGVVFTTKGMYNDLGATSESAKTNIRMAVKRRLDTQKDVVLYGNKDGTYRKVSTKLDLMNIYEKPSSFYDMKWPLGIEKLAYMLPRNIAVIAGAKSSGKSAMMMNVALLNRDTKKVRYISSEMAVDEMRLRLSKFKDSYGQPLNLEVWRNVEFIYKTSNFADIIDPDALNIVDFLEIHDEFWKVGEKIAEIHNKLNTGVAVIGIQKARGKDVGRGADFTLEKARIYVSLDKLKVGNAAKLIEVKTPVESDESPRGLICEYKLHGGCNFYVMNSWHIQEEQES